MNTKLTLRLEDTLVQEAKQEARRQGKTVSQMVSDYFSALSRGTPKETSSLPPVTASLVGILKGCQASEDDYKRHIQEKHR